MSLLPFSHMPTIVVSFMQRSGRGRSGESTPHLFRAGDVLAVALLISAVVAVVNPPVASADSSAASNPGKTDAPPAESSAPAVKGVGPSRQTSFVPGPPGAKEPPAADTSTTQAPAWQPSKDQEAQLKQRVEERWAAVIKRDFKTAYEYETPEFKKGHSAEQYAGQFGSAIEWRLATVKSIGYDRPDEADVVIAIDYSFNLPGGDQPARTTGNVHETWLFADGQWWRRDIEQPLGGGEQTEASPK